MAPELKKWELCEGTACKVCTDRWLQFVNLWEMYSNGKLILHDFLYSLRMLLVEWNDKPQEVEETAEMRAFKGIIKAIEIMTQTYVQHAQDSDVKVLKPILEARQALGLYPPPRARTSK